MCLLILNGFLKLPSMVKRQRAWVNQFGDGKTTEKIIEVLMEKLQ
jgi:hypothetical protein